MGNKYREVVGTPDTQKEPIAGRETEMKKNNAGGFSFILDPWKQLERFLILGSEGGTYYVSEKELTKRNIKCLEACVKEDPERVAIMAMDISKAGRAFKNDPAELAVAYLIAEGGTARIRGWEAMQTVIRTGRTLLEFTQLLDTFGVKWPMSRRNAFAKWYDGRSADQVAYQVIKYPTANKWSQLDLIRLCHPTVHADVYRYLAGKEYGDVPELIVAWEAIKAAKTEKEVIKLIDQYKLTWEFVPGEWQGKKDVWQALLPNLPYTALIRNLGRMTSYGLLNAVNDNVKFVREKLTNRDGLRKARVHPMQALIAWRAYKEGGANRGFSRDNALTWTANQQVMAALEDAFYMSFDTVEPSNKDMFLGIDVSGSMTMKLSNLPITCCEAATVLAMVSLRTEKNSIAYGFNVGIQDMGLNKNDSFGSAFNKLANVNGGGTDCSLPMVYALDNGMNFDQFVVLTDNETWAGHIHPSKALQKYREMTGIPARLVVVGMTATDISIADPKDSGMLDVAGFDTSVPPLISRFAQGL